MEAKSGTWFDGSKEEGAKVSGYEGKDEKLKAENDESDELFLEDKDLEDEPVDNSDGILREAMDLLLEALEIKAGRQTATLVMTFFLALVPL